MKKRLYQQYTLEFKHSAVQVSIESEETIQTVAVKLMIDDQCLHSLPMEKRLDAQNSRNVYANRAEHGSREEPQGARAGK